MERFLPVLFLALIGVVDGHTKIGFSAQVTGQTPVYIGNIVKFNSVTLDSHMDVDNTGVVPTSGHYVCPITGDYQINILISAFNKNTLSEYKTLFNLYRGNSVIMATYAYGDRGGVHTSTGASNVVTCTKGQSLHVRMDNCFTYSCATGLDMRYSHFSGYLLRATEP